MALVSGDVLNNRYRIVALLGQGGMGAVYRAWDLNLKMAVALKENSDTSAEAHRQFEREAALLSRLSHPNLPRVTDHFVLPDSGQYLVMDYIEGEDLEAMLARRGRLPEAQVLEWVAQVCDALSYLHSRPQPVIHRDIKPANIRIAADDGRVVLVDFGISKLYDPGGRTTVGAQAVTPGYSPPEQYGGGATDARSDIYALGATLYHLLTGSPPPESIKRMAGEGDVMPPQRLNPAVSPFVGEAILAALALPTGQRFQNAAALKAALTAPEPAAVGAGGALAMAGQTAVRAAGYGLPPVPEPSPRRASPLVAALAVLLIIAVTAVGFLLVRGGLVGPVAITPTEAAATAETGATAIAAVTVVVADAGPTAALVPSKTAEAGATATAESAAVLLTAAAPPPTSSPLPAPTATPRCPLVEGLFADVWLAFEEQLGCALGEPRSHNGAEEQFELGWMFWRSDAIDYGQALVAFNNGAWRIFQHAPFVEGSPDFKCPDAITPPECPPTPKRGFGMMWCDIGAIRGGLGNALECERAYSGTQQQFQRGFLLRTNGGTFVFLNDGTWQWY